MRLRSTLVLAITLFAACGGGQKRPANIGSPTIVTPPGGHATTPGATTPGATTEQKKPAVPMATDAQCGEVIDHVVELILAAPDVPEAAKTEWKEKEAAAREQMMHDCRLELTVPQYQCLMSKQTYAAIAECK